MKPRIPLASFLLVALAAACHAQPDESAADREAQLAARLQADTGVPWKVYIEPSANEVRFLAPMRATSNGLAGSTIEEKARALFDRYADALGNAKLERLRVRDTVTDSYGNRSVRFEHLLAGTDLPIFDAASVAEMTSDGALIHLEPGFRHDLSGVAIAPAITSAKAEQAALAHARGACGLAAGDQIVKRASALGVSSERGAPAALAWAVDLRSSAASCVAPRVFVNATNGDVILMRETAAAITDHAGGVMNRLSSVASDIKEIDVSARNGLTGLAWTMQTSAPSPKVTTYAYSSFQFVNEPIDTVKLGSWDDLSAFPGEAVDAHDHATKALAFYSEVFQRRGTDGQGADLSVIVHDPEAVSTRELAFYKDAGTFFVDEQLHIGDGSPDFWPVSVGFDVVAHELTHGVTQHTSGLLSGAKESGALNESFSDAMAAAAENWLPETRNEGDNVLIAERATRNGRGLRNMVDPSEVFEDNTARNGVDMYTLMPPCEAPAFANDYCGRHINAGIANKAFTLMTMGGTHKRNGQGVAIGMGWERGRSLWYNTFTKLTPRANFAAVAYLQLAVARVLGPDVLNATACAWFAVGVLGAQDLAFDNLTCSGFEPTNAPSPAPSAPTKAGCTSSAQYICSDGTPGFATPCDSRKHDVYCADPTHTCTRASASDPTATVDEDGVLTCE